MFEITQAQILVATGLAVYALVLLFAWALCVVAGRADDEMAEWYRRQHGEES